MLPEFANESAALGLGYAFGVLLIFIVAAVVANVVLSAAVNHRRRANQHSLDARILNTIKGPLVLFIVILGLLMAYLAVASLPHPVSEFLARQNHWAFRVWMVVVAIEVSYLVSHLLQALTLWYLENVAQRTSTNLDDKLLPQVRRVTPIVVYALGILMALDLMGVSITPLVAGLGIGGLAVALALQPTLSNFFSGTYLITEGELNEGDFVELDKGPSGFVVDVGWRSTKVRDRFNNLILIPNSKMIDSIMINYYSHSKAMTVFVACGVSYDSNLKHVEEVSLDVAGSVKRDVEEAVDDYEPLIYFTAFGDSNIDFVLLLQANDRAGSFVVRHELIKCLHSRFNQEGIEINYPVRRLVMPPANGAAHVAGSLADGGLDTDTVPSPEV